MLKIGLTGGIGCGKTSVSKLFKDWGAYIFDADKEAKAILNSNETAQNEIITEFGTDVLGHNNQIDKTKLARIAFSDEDHQLRLNAIIHPYVFSKIDATFDKVLDNGGCEIFVVDAALIYESSADTHMDYVITVTAHLKIRTERVLSRGTLTRDQFLRRLYLQWPEEDKVQMADFVIHNNGTEYQLENEAKIIFDHLN